MTPWNKDKGDDLPRSGGHVTDIVNACSVSRPLGCMEIA